ncbi:MAG TPA: hypothetical protein VHQ44_11920, partial [Thermoanaerobaculia bacterium]|nr:hypothetical protein [Thermoanaerobaculia bacterium]
MVLCHRATGSPQSESTVGPAPAADPVAAALAGFDETTGLWFPPDAPRDVYLDRSDPKHDLILDVRKAFDANPALRRAVCALAADPKREVRASTLSQSVRQRITMFQMLCAGIEANEEEKAKSEKAWSESEARFEKWMNVAAARELSLDERRNRMLQLDAELEKHAVDDAHLKAAFGMLGLMPQSEYVVYRLLRTSPYHGGGKSETRFQDFLRRLLERESADGRPEAPRYRMALRHLLFYGNRFPEARALSRRLVDEEALARWKTDNRAFLALLDRLAGDASALKSAASSCEPPEREKGAYEGRPGGAYCFDVALGAATRSIDLLGEKASKGLVDVLAEVIAAEPANWSHRVNA